MGDWTRIYATDASGSVTFGTLFGLVQAVRAGADVKVVYRVASGRVWSRYCASVSTYGSGVSATYMEAADTTNDGTGLKFESPFLLEYHIYNSNGTRWMVKGGTGKQDTIAMTWYVKDFVPQWLTIAAHLDETRAFERMGRDTDDG